VRVELQRLSGMLLNVDEPFSALMQKTLIQGPLFLKIIYINAIHTVHDEIGGWCEIISSNTPELVV